MTTSEQEIDTRDVVLPAFYDFWRATREDYIQYVCKGGRSSSKSTSISLRLIMDLIENPITIICIRRYEKHIRHTVYEQLKAAIRLFRLEGEFNYGISPLEITYLGRGNKIIFIGGDDPQRIKGIKIAEFPIARLWVEEVTEFRQEEELDIIIGSFLRASLPDNMQYKIYYSYNPPKRKTHWVNKKWNTKFLSSRTYVHDSTYLTNPFTAPETLFEINEMKEKQHMKYRWMYLGELIGGGIVPFQNLTFRKITDEEIKSFDNIKQGIDWGYSIHEFSFVRLHYDKTRRKIYFIDEIFGLQLSQRYIIEQILNREYSDIRITADSAEPKSISEVRNAGIKISGAKKGSGSVEFGEKWLNDLEEIVIDYDRTPGLAKEFEEADYKIDANGNIKDQLNDKGTNCFVAGTLIKTINGDIPIEQIKIGDKVLTRYGYKKVLKLFNNELTVINSPIGLVGTPSHKIITTNGERYLLDLTLSDILYIFDNKISERKCYYIMVKNIIKQSKDICPDILQRKNLNGRSKINDYYISRFGLIMDLIFRMVIIYIIWMGINLIIKLKTSNVCLKKPIFQNTLKNIIRIIKLKLENTLIILGTKPKYGIVPMQGNCGIQSTPNNMDLDTSIYQTKSVRFAKTNINPKELIKSSVPIIANLNIEELKDSILLKKLVGFVEKLSLLININKTKLVREVAPIEIEKRKVYNFMVEGKHEYFANGILVGNSVDATRYALEDDMTDRRIKVGTSPF